MCVPPSGSRATIAVTASWLQRRLCRLSSGTSTAKNASGRSRPRRLTVSLSLAAPAVAAPGKSPAATCARSDCEMSSMMRRCGIYRSVVTRRSNYNLRLARNSSQRVSIVRQCASGRRAMVVKGNPLRGCSSTAPDEGAITGSSLGCHYCCAMPAPLPLCASVRTTGSSLSPTMPQSMYSRFKLARCACCEASAT